MEVFARGASPLDATRSAVTIGVYDGVHLGHRHTLELLQARARRDDLVSVVVTFDPHPMAVLAPERARPALTTFERRLELLGELGIDRCCVVRFDEVVATEPAETFVRDVLVGELRAAAVVVGEDFRFGHGRTGDVSLLGELAADGRYDVVPVGLVHDAVGAISSTRIRVALAGGDVETAAALLGRPHELEGTVVRGDGRGRGLGYPTANLAVTEGLCVPDVGIYAGTWTRPSGERHAAAISVGRRPTFYEHADVLVEAHLLDADLDLYDEPGRVGFVERLRGEERFETVDALVAQIGRDVEATRSIVGRERSASG